MVPPHFAHKYYVCFVQNKASRYGGLPTDHRHFQVWRKLKVTNLDAPILSWPRCIQPTRDASPVTRERITLRTYR